MTQQPFNRPGAIDLSALKRPAAPAPTGAGGAPGGAGGAGASSYAVDVTAENFQSVVEMSMTAPVLIVLFSRSRMPESGRLADDLATLSGEFEGKFVAGLVDVDVAPQIAQAMQVESIPLVVAVIDGRPAPLFQDAIGIDEMRTALTQVMQQLATQGMTGRHQPLGAAPAEDDAAEPQSDPRYAAAEDALARNDLDAAVSEYQKLVTANPADTEAAAGLAMATVLQRTQGVDLDAARAEAEARPDDVDAQTLVADLDLLGGRVEDAFSRLVELVRRSVGKDRDRAREHLLGLFAAVGNDDERVLKGRQSLASALY
ncbi:MAG: tetratricopeptide repeat protein [Nocardioides sp.]|uniref:co-chaperone YbbN n=1 Tax=Nocardioides sp. TaxID=35761 RepID=UPI002396A326|nr:tetratricopeptide repeat protein [Nocardioides sp.]MDE0775122.1 tetratricopeptide repeat protein [Nocardioides sp.]